MTWSEIDWPALDRLRTGFLSGSAAAGFAGAALVVIAFVVHAS
jgi:hypothetical protein